MNDVVGLREAGIASVRPSWLLDLEKLLGSDRILTSLPDLWAYSRDRAPYATFHVRHSQIPTSLPSAVACPGTSNEVAEVVRFARVRRIPVIPYGAGSGVLGGALPLDHELMIDLKRLNQIIECNEFDGTVTVQAGMNGGQFEEELNKRGWTCGHLPQSLYMSTVGGWAACRGAGQTSTRFGKIEDIVLGLVAVMPDGSELRVRPVARRAVGPSIKDIIIGSEGAFGIITELTLRMWRLPEVREGVVLAFPTLQAGVDALRTIMQAELRPAVVRLYDEIESAQRVKGLTAFQTHPFLAILEFSGNQRLVDVEQELALEIAAAYGAVQSTQEPYQHWLQHRYESYSPKWQAQGYFMDTIEVTTPWSQLPALYERIRTEIMSITEGVYFGTHWSHVYPEGACQYMTIRLPPMGHEEGLKLHRQVWDRVERACLELGGSISHHHGAGVLRNSWLRTELGNGHKLLQNLKDSLDPDNLLVPGKLGLRSRPGAVNLEARSKAE